MSSYLPGHVIYTHFFQNASSENNEARTVVHVFIIFYKYCLYNCFEYGEI